MRKIIVFFLCVAIACSIAGPAWAKDVTTIAVLPFSVHSADNIDYVRNGVWDMLISRLSASDKEKVINKNAVAEALKKTAGKDLTAADVYGIGTALKADYVVWGSITKIGNSISLDGKLFDVAASASPVGIFEQCQGLDELIPRMDIFAKKIQYHLLGQVPTTVIPPAQPAPAPASPKPADDRSPAEIPAVEALKTREGTLTAIINPEFIDVTRRLDRKGFWMSRKYPIEFKGMDIGDVNNDGVNEIVLIDDKNVMVYDKTETDIKLLKKISGSAYDNNIAVDVADINNNGVPEIIVTSMQGGNLGSFVLEFREGSFVRIASGLGWFMRVITISGEPLLVGQTLGIVQPFENPIHEIVWKDGTYAKGRRMPVPEGLSVYGFTIDSVDGTEREQIIALDEYDHLFLCTKTEKPISKIHVFGGGDELLWKSEAVFGGSNVSIDYKSSGGIRSENVADSQEKTLINVRILTYDINKNGKKEIIIVKNLSATGRLFRQSMLFTKSEIYDLEWDGLGMVQNWKTRTIQGYVADYQFKDIDNDGENEVVLALVLSHGGTKGRSVVVAYDLKRQ